jgi:hypothetical protein
MGRGTAVKGRFLRFGVLAVLVTTAMLVYAATASASLTINYVFNGHGGYSADGLGQNETGGMLDADVPTGSTVQKAFLYGTYIPSNEPLDVTERTIDFDGTLVETVEISAIVAGETILRTTRADVTAQVAAKVGAGGGTTSFAVNNDPSLLDGVALVVVFGNAALPESTIAVLGGGASTTGDTATFVLASPLDKTVPGFQATMSLGSGYSYQGIGGHACGGGQYSTVDVNSARLTSCAGNYDDGLGNNGALITVGGVGDSTNNPADPNSSSDGEDDELYNLAPLLAQGTTSIEINTANPSGDDNLFLSVISISAKATVTNEDCNDGIDNDGDGLIDGNDPDCTVTPPPPTNTCGTIQGNGVPRENSKAKFAFNVRYKTNAPAPTGSVSFNDKSTPMNFASTSIASLVISGDAATVTGNGTANGSPVTFTLKILDKPDTFSIQLSNGYTATWTPKQGKVEIKHSC